MSLFAHIFDFIKTTLLNLPVNGEWIVHAGKMLDLMYYIHFKCKSLIQCTYGELKYSYTIANTTCRL